MPSEASLPTLDKLRATVPTDLDAKKVVAQWLEGFASLVKSGNIDAISDLFVDDALFRDILVLTWDFRTFEGTNEIKKFLQERIPEVKPTGFKLKDEFLGLQQPYPDLAWNQALFEFETDVGLASGIVRLVPLSDGKWKAHTVFTNLEDLKGFPERTGPLRDAEPNHGKWAEKRRKEVEFEDEEPRVVIVGGGQGGLELAARLKFHDLPTLVVERHPRIGDQWRSRYEALCLHDPVWYDHMPYIPFPPSWPVYTPALKLADWLESYAHSLELNVWTSSTVTHARQDPSTKKWSVTIKRKDGSERVFHPNHVVFAVGIGGGLPNMPVYPGMEDFSGKILHSSQHGKATDHAGKRVIVVGACTSSHDICADYVDHGIDVTMIQRGETYIMSTKKGMPILMGALYAENAPPTDVADRMNASFPNKLTKLMHQRIVKTIAEADKDTLDGLKKRGFKLTLGEDDSGFLLMAWEKAGGYYLDVGASQLIIDGKIKLKNDSRMERLTKTGIKFEDGSELSADVVIFATGYGDPREPIQKILGDELGSKVKRIWGLDDEKEMYGVWRDIGVPNLWAMMGNLALSRFHSKHLALQIKAIEENIFGTRYSYGDA